MDHRKLAEDLVILNGHAETLLPALYSMKYILDPDTYPTMDSVLAETPSAASTTSNGGSNSKSATPRSEQPLLFREAAFQPILKTLLKKFPECPDISKVGSSGSEGGDRLHESGSRLPGDGIIRESADGGCSAILRALRRSC